MSKQLQIRNSTAEFLIFQAEDKAQGVQVFYKDETIWATQKAMATLFDVDRSVITKHLKNIFETGELQQDSVSAKFAHTAEDGKTYSTLFYKLDAIISVGYRVNSIRATQFRQFGVNRCKTEAERIKVKMSAYDANYMRTLPIHGSLFELERNDEYSIFGFYVAQTYDFIQELRKFGSTLEVLEPAHLRDEFKEKSENLAKMYENSIFFA